MPVDGAMDFIPLELVMACESPSATTAWDGEAQPGLYWGFDVARKRDLYLVQSFEKLEDGTKFTRGVITMRALPFAEQQAIASEVAKVAERGCVDATGIGANIAENLATEFGARRGGHVQE